MAAMAIVQRGNAALGVDRTHGGATSAQFGPLRLTLAITAMSDGCSKSSKLLWAVHGHPR